MPSGVRPGSSPAPVSWVVLAPQPAGAAEGRDAALHADAGAREGGEVASGADEGGGFFDGALSVGEADGLTHLRGLQSMGEPGLVKLTAKFSLAMRGQAP